jgi:two-component system sensor histidine kinase DesK
MGHLKRLIEGIAPRRDLARASMVATRLPTAGLLWAIYLVWLPFLIPPIVAQARSTSAPRIILTLLAAALFAVVYIWTGWHNAHDLTRFAPPRARPAWKLWLPIVILTLLSLVLTVTSPGEWGGLFIFTAASAGGRLPVAQALGMLGGIVLLGTGVGWLLHLDWSYLGPGLGLTIIVGITVICTMRSILAAVIANRELRTAREEIARLAVAEERLRFARDLHDLLGHTLSLIALKSELARRLVRPAPERAVAEIGDVEAAARTALHEVREAVAGYHQPALPSELAAARELLAAAGIALTQTGTPPAALPGGVEAVLAWTVREGVTNVIRHSRARSCTIRLTREPDAAGVEVRDDGDAEARRTARQAAGSAGSGLRGLAERVRALGGDCEAEPIAGGGFRLAVWVPIERDAPVAPDAPSPLRESQEGSWHASQAETATASRPPRGERTETP